MQYSILSTLDIWLKCCAIDLELQMVLKLGLYSFTIFCLRYQLIIMILAIISVIIDQSDRNNNVPQGWLCLDWSPTQKSALVLWHALLCWRLVKSWPHPTRSNITHVCFQKSKQTRWWGCFLMDSWQCKFIKTWKICWRW